MTSATLELLAAHAAVAIHNARQYKEIQEAKAMVGNMTAVAWMGTVAGAWPHSVGNGYCNLRPDQIDTN